MAEVELDSPARAMGIWVATGYAYMAVAVADEFLPDAAPDRVGVNDQLSDSAQLEDFRRRIAQVIRVAGPAAVGVARTKKYQGWSYTQGFQRFSLEAAVLIAAAQENVPARIVKQEDAARGVEVPLPRLRDMLAAKLGIDQTPHWADRSVAIATAVTVARELS